MSNDPFEQLAEEHMTAHMRSRLRANATRAERKREKELQERAQLFGQWTKWHKERKDALLAGQWCRQAQELAEFLERMTLEDAPALIQMVEHGPWRTADADTRFLVLELISHSIIHIRERAGLPTFDDPLPDEEPTAFITIRDILGPT